MMKYIVKNDYTVWGRYTDKDDAEGMARYLNKKYHNGYYVCAEELEAQEDEMGTVEGLRAWIETSKLLTAKEKDAIKKGECDEARVVVTGFLVNHLLNKDGTRGWAHCYYRGETDKHIDFEIELCTKSQEREAYQMLLEEVAGMNAIILKTDALTLATTLRYYK